MEAEEFNPGLANNCPNFSDFPFQLKDYNNEIRSDIQSEVLQEGESNHHKHSVDKYPDNTENGSGLVILICVIFSVLILISCVSITYVIVNSLKNDEIYRNVKSPEVSVNNTEPKDVTEFLV